jgi:hypothetical protein
MEGSMSKTDENIMEHESREVVRLKVEGASSVVNTIRDQQTARGLSLVCPFPALEAEIPVSFGPGGEDVMRNGTIHRIGVEDDPETGLPRLRLSIRARETRATVVASPPKDLLDETSQIADTSPEDADTDLDLNYMSEFINESCNSIDAEDEVDAYLSESEVSVPEIEVPDLGPDPAWVGDELPLPEEFVERMKTRRRRRLTGIAAWSTVLVVAVAGVYMLVRAGIVDAGEIRELISGITQDQGSAGASADEVVSALNGLDAVGGAATGDEGHGSVYEAAPESTAVSEIDQIPELMEVSQEQEEPTGSAPSAAESAEVAVAVESAGEETVPETTADDITLLLPTRWRAEYANAYRLRNPNGVVVDVPGGLVSREGYIEAGAGHPMIRSIKAVQRETGARFIVFIHGELPRFFAATRPGGISLRLFREAADDKVTEQVAMLP